jgi:integrase
MRAEMLLRQAEEEHFFASRGLTNLEKANKPFFDYWRSFVNNKTTTQNNANVFMQTMNKLIAYKGNQILIHQVNYAYCRDFLSFLQNTLKKNGEKLSSSSIDSYFKKLNLVLKELVKEGIILKNPAQDVKVPKVIHKRREWLTLEEIELLINAECDIKNLKYFYLLSCFTGLRHSDIKNLTWKDYIIEGDKHFFKIYIQKTGKDLVIPVNHNARQILEQIGRKSDDDKIVVGLKYGSWSNLKLKQWGMRAGINKDITPHTARHTFATNFAMEGGNPMVLQELLGHSEFKATKVYVQIAETKKFTEMDKMPKLNINQ